MKEKIPHHQILKTITEVISEALMVDANSITAETRLFADLAAESIDIVDIRFRMERAFGFKIDQHDLMHQLGPDLTNDEIVQRFTAGYLATYIEDHMR
jgi:acyl carrier protein